MQKVTDEAVLLDLGSQNYFGLDPVGTLIWEAIAEERSEIDIVQKITEEFDVDADTARNDLLVFLEQLQTDKLIAIE